MLEIEVLVIELSTIDRFSASSIAGGEITTLDHELLDDSVKDRAFVRKGLAGFAFAFLASAESSEVLGGLGYDIVVQLEADPTFWFVANCDIEIDSAAFL
jgi:hypothetical protein